MNNFTIDRRVVLLLRLLMGWTFLYAGASQILEGFSAGPFLEHTHTFHALYAPLAAPEIVPYLSFAVKWGQLLIGLSLVSGLLVRVSGVFAGALLLTYWTAHMDFPYIESRVNFLVDYHIVYAVVTFYLVAVNAGRSYGLDGWRADRQAATNATDLIGVT